MRYVFENVRDENDTIEVDRPMSQAPKIGAKLRRNGKVYRRRLELPRFSTGFKPHVSWSLDPYDPATAWHGTRTDGSDGLPKGLIAFDSQRSRTEFAARTQDTASPVILDP